MPPTKKSSAPSKVDVDQAPDLITDQPQLTDPLTEQAENQDLRRLLAETQQELEAAKAQLAERPDREQLGSADRGFMPRDTRSTTTKPTWRFRVQDIGEKFEALELDVVDESEAIRVYCILTTEANGKPLDTTRYHFRVTCLDEAKRNASIRWQIEESARKLGDPTLPVAALSPAYKDAMAADPVAAGA